MDSLAARADTVRNAVTSISTCNPTVSATLKDLFQTNDTSNDSAKPGPRPRTTKISRAPSKANTNSVARNASDNGQSLTAKEKAILATQVITASLKALGEAAKTASSQSQDTPEPPKNVLAKSAVRNVVQRSNSVPMKPIQRQLNRTTTSPSVPKTIRSPTPLPSSTGCLSLIECVRTSFSALSALESSKALHLPAFQWENGMSSFINKLISLNHFDLAIKELKILKRRLERKGGEDVKSTATRTKVESNMSSRTLPELLDFTKTTISSPAQLGLMISCQLQVLRITHGLKKSTYLEGMLPFLREDCLNSPIKLLLLSLKDDNPDQTKCVRNLESLSQSLLSLTPGVSTKDDDTAVEPRLSPNTEVALEVQALGLVIRLQSWSVSGHRGDVDKDILSPLSKCLGAFVRRSPSSNFSIIFSVFSQIWKRIEKLGLRPTESSRSPLAAIYQVLAIVARESGNANEAKKWVGKIKSLTDPSEDSAARCCSIAAQLLALSLKQWSQINENLLMEVLEGLRGPLGGTTAEMDDLLVSVCLLRKSVMSLVVEKREGSSSLSQATMKLLESFIFQLPRFTLRWLGKPPSSANGTKDLLRFEQRRGTLSTQLPQILDSALLFAKLLLDDGQLAWDTMDSTLQDCLTILEYMGDLARPGTKINPTPSYHVKISHFYYQQHLALRKASSKATEAASLKALRKSIDSVKNRSEAEQSRAQLLVKWERFAELCRASGRQDDAIDALRSIRDHLVRQEVVPKITEKLATEPWSIAWQLNPDVDQLSRTVCNLAKLDRKHNEWTWLLSGSNKATALEHDLYAIILKDPKYEQEADLSGSIVKSLLQIYSAERYPIRRLRALLHLLAVKIGAQDEVIELRGEIEVVLKIIRGEALADDSGLIRYVSHLQALATCILGIATADINTPPVKEALANWKTMVSKCESAEQLSAHIDNPTQLLTILQSLVDFARIEGLETLQTEILELSISISKLSPSSNFEVLISQSIALCQQHLSHGWSSKAEKLLQDNEERLSQPDADRELVIAYQLVAAEYHLSLGAMDKAEQHMSNARDAETTLSYEPGSRKGRSAHKRITIARAYSLMSTLALERGDCYNALRFARTAVRKLFHDWSKLDEMRNASHDATMDDSSQAEASEKDQSLNNSYLSQSDMPRAATGPEYWALSHPLFHFLLQLSSVYSHVGVYQETLYYAEQAQKVAKSIGSAVYMSQALAWMAHVWLMAGKSEKAMEIATEMKPIALDLEPTYQNAKVLCRLSSIYGELEDPETQAELLTKAESMLEVLSSADKDASDPIASELEAKMTKLSIEEKPVSKVPVRRNTTRVPRATKTATKKQAPKKAIPAPPVEVLAPVKVEDAQLSFLRGLILQSQSAILIANDDCSTAVTTLRSAYELSRIPADVSQICFLMGVALIRQSLEQIGQDAVFSVIQDSTLSFPSVTRSLKERTPADRLSLPQTPAPRRGRGPSKKAINDTRSFIEKLREAQGHLLTAHSIASLNGDGDLVHRIAVALQSVVILLSNTNSTNPAASHPFHATCAVELARNLTWRRERKTVHLDSSKDSKIDWPVLTNDTGSRRTSLGLCLDMDGLLKDFVDIVPKTWNVVSLSLSHDERDLCITKLQGGQEPFGIRLPLERAALRDADLEVLSFQQGRAELQEIIEMANRTCHDARDMSQKGAKSAWWAEREELDERLKSLMECIEQSWLAGFRGIFSQHRRRADLIAKFEKDFMKILDKHLPSRRKVHGRKAAAKPTTRVNLDPRVYDMIIGLGDPTAPEGDLDEPLMDLLYYIVDILQFHGERNAYDEVDFDEMVIDTYDALNSYYVTAKGIKEPEEGTHTILVLDKSLHPFPFEALPCLQGLAVSRVFSLDCLRRQILDAKLAGPDAAKKDTEETSGPNVREGHYVSVNSGTYILNPGCDLKNTQATFGEPLSTLPLTWNNIEMREPTEAEFEAALKEKDLLLYFGHGSGAQYIRGRTIRKMEKCRAVALLMGCSSASLAEVGRFESYGTVRNYMLSGSPAVVGTLWDVTDRDIDRFAGRVFEEWGLLPKGSFAEDAKGKRNPARKRIGVVESTGDRPVSLTEAVGRARDACRFRYLTAAAVCVYGIPVYLKDR
ncbi:peptidase family C50-domain-containing protein [Annulohypoxylon maeteangense]|uniref:peptidase family C50-domain-containing protein n=1 Tax=Annulohypoxylon maeteangense TaxID=1927788 RepID=UPI002007CDA5|nr:peptidase family C50-domain-containing protein [Annulohypoxylon maeteangense]KAI0887445.1 peptidase family C50-domain-containing protein [Annulohypoxylon maeteangense]